MRSTTLSFLVVILIISILAVPVSAAPLIADTPTPITKPTSEPGLLKVCKVAGQGVDIGQIFTIVVDDKSYEVPAGPKDGGYCVLAGQYPPGTLLTVQEVMISGYYVSRIKVKPDRVVSTDLAQGAAVVKLGSGVTEVIFTNVFIGSSIPTLTSTPLLTNTPKPTRTATATPGCSPNCTPTSTRIPTGRMQICKEADGPDVTGYFTFRFADESVIVPVGACSGLTGVDAGTLTVSEDLQAGYSVTDIYTIPADRLISADPGAQSATVTIVEGSTASQTIVVFRNQAVAQTATSTLSPTPTNTAGDTPTSTATGTPISTATFTPTSTATGTSISTATFTPTSTTTGTPISSATFTPTSTATGTPISSATFTPTSTATGTSISTATFTPTSTATGTPVSSATFTPTNIPTSTPSICVPIVPNFSPVAVNSSVEGLGAVDPNLNIDATGTAVHVLQGTSPILYRSTINGAAVINGGMVTMGGFGDPVTQAAGRAPEYTFTFAPGFSVGSFSLRMLDYGDYNPTGSTTHVATMTAYNASNVVVASQQISYTTNGNISNLYGDMLIAGDATSASPGQPGNWTWNVSGNGIVKIVLGFGAGYDPNLGFDSLSYTSENCGTPIANATFTPTNTPSSCVPIVPNFSPVAVNSSVEGLGAVDPNLNIDATGTAVHVLQGTSPILYRSTINGAAVINGGMVTMGGFGDPVTQAAGRAPEYTFTFAPGFSVGNFSLRMLDYGDYNPTGSTTHVATMTAYNASNVVVASQQISYTTNGNISNLYGDMLIAGDATSASPGQPGNWTWNVSGNGIVKIVLGFGAGYDPNLGFDSLSYTSENCDTP